MPTTFQVNPQPTFRATVDIPVAGGDPMPLELEFSHRTVDELKALFETFEGRKDIDCIMDFVSGWHNVSNEQGEKTEFSREAMDALLQNYGRASLAIRNAYVFELTGARLGN